MHFFCTQLTFDLILRIGGIFRLGIHPSVFSYISRNILAWMPKCTKKMPAEFFLALRIGKYCMNEINIIRIKMIFLCFFFYINTQVSAFTCAHKNGHFIKETDTSDHIAVWV